MSIVHERTIKLIGMLTTILGSSLNPFVSSSKNLISPPLEAGSGADFLLLLIVNSQDHDFDIKTLLASPVLVLNKKFLFFAQKIYFESIDLLIFLDFIQSLNQ